jgi:predicted ATPase
MTRLVSLDLHGFKSIKSLSNFEIGDMTVLIGPNGAGKSNLLGFFRLLQRMATPPGDLQLEIARLGGGNTLLHHGSRRTAGVDAAVVIEGASRIRYSVRLLHVPEDTLVTYGETVVLNPDGNDPILLYRGGGRESVLANRAQSNPFVHELRHTIQRIGLYHFQDTSPAARIRQRWRAADALELKDDAGNLAPFLLRLRRERPQHYDRIVANLRLTLAHFADFVLEPADNETLLLLWREAGSDLVFGPSQASDGTLRLMALVTLLLQPANWLPPLLIVDEPELGLHPSAIHLVAGLLKAVSQHVQVIVATQSTALLDHFDPAEVVVVDRDDEGSHFRRLDSVRLQDWLAEYSMGELWEKNVLGGNPA